MKPHSRKSRRVDRNEENDRVDSLSPMDQRADKDHHRTSSPRKASPPASRKPSSSIPTPQFVSFANTSELLIHLSKRIIEIINSRDYGNPFLNCLSPDLIFNSDKSQYNGKDRILRGHRALTTCLPDYDVRIQHASAVIDESAGRATVLMTMKVSGYAYNTNRQSIAQFTWTRHQDRWTCAAYNLVRGVEFFE